jgi:DNA mismatch endonuclease (patch repair protein)
MDILSQQARSKIMASIRSKNTKPELAVRSALHRMGFRFRLHSNKMPGKPDIILPKYKAVVWVHGCFWHGHCRCRAGQRPKSNIAYWHPKIARTIQRDKLNKRKITRLGWRNFVFWECETLDPRRFEEKLGLVRMQLRHKKRAFSK